MYLAGDLTTPFRLRDVSGGGLSFPFQLRHITSLRRRDTFQRRNVSALRPRDTFQRQNAQTVRPMPPTMTTAKLALRWGGREGAASNARGGRGSEFGFNRQAGSAQPFASRSKHTHTVLFAPGALRSAQPKHDRGLHGPRVSAEAQKAEIREPIVSDNHRKLDGAFP